MTISYLKLAQAQKTVVRCNSSSPECCWVVESWREMGRTASVSLTDATACCSGIHGVTCTFEEDVTKVIQIDWLDEGLQGRIPPQLGKLVNLQEL